MPKIDFKTTPEERILLDQILDRAARDGLISDRLSADMDLVACHSNGCPIDFERLLRAPKDSFWHDFIGITNNLNRTTGKLDNHFDPRTSVPVCDDSRNMVPDGDVYRCPLCGKTRERANPLTDSRCEPVS